MKKRYCLMGAAALLAIAIIPSEVMASSTSSVSTIGGEKELSELASGLETFLFGAPIKIAAFAGAAYGCIMGLIQHAYMKAITGVGFGIFAVKVPAIINSIYGSTAVSSATIALVLGS